MFEVNQPQTPFLQSYHVNYILIHFVPFLHHVYSFYIFVTNKQKQIIFGELTLKDPVLVPKKFN